MSGQKKHKSFSFKAYAWAQFKKNKPAYFSLWVLGTLAMVAIFAPIIANDQPLYASYKGHTLFPAFSFSNSYELQMDLGGLSCRSPSAVIGESSLIGTLPGAELLALWGADQHVRPLFSKHAPCLDTLGLAAEVPWQPIFRVHRGEV